MNNVSEVAQALVFIGGDPVFPTMNKACQGKEIPGSIVSPVTAAVSKKDAAFLIMFPPLKSKCEMY